MCRSVGTALSKAVPAVSRHWRSSLSVEKKSLIVPIPKSNNPRELNDLCLVALTSTAMTWFEKLILKQLLCEVSPLADPNQFAYLAESGV